MLYMLGDDFSISDDETEKVACQATFQKFYSVFDEIFHNQVALAAMRQRIFGSPYQSCCLFQIQMQGNGECQGSLFGWMIGVVSLDFQEMCFGQASLRIDICRISYFIILSSRNRLPITFMCHPHFAHLNYLSRIFCHYTK